MTLACIFPGQGSQALGMGKALYDNFTQAREAYQEVDDALGSHLSRIIFGDDEEALTATENAQPAIMVTSIAALRVLQQQAGFDIASTSFVAGHSLGEYSALCAAGCLTLADTARLLRLRGQSMQEAAPADMGSMAAILGLELAQVEALLSQHEGGICEIANDNAPGQIVVSGERGAVETMITLAKEAGAKRAIALNVSAPFHSSLIASAAESMREALDAVEVSTPRPALIANVTAEAVQEASAIKAHLVEQVTGRVRWRESVNYMVAQGVDSTLEIGHGAVLSGLNRRTNRDITSHKVGTPDDIDAWVKQAA